MSALVRSFITTGILVAMAAATLLSAAAAPWTLPAVTAGSAPGTHATSASLRSTEAGTAVGQVSQGSARPTVDAVSQGRLFGEAISTLARTLPRGPEHGKLISAFARTANPSHLR